MVSIPAAILTLALLATSCDLNSHPRSVSGTIETDEARVASRYGGRVENIFVNEGDSLKPGQEIAELEANELRAKRDQVAASLQEFEEGPRKEELEAAQHDWEALVADLELARIDAKRAEDVFAKQGISQAERDAAVSKQRALEKSVAASRSRYDLLLAGTRAARLAFARAQLAEMDAQLREMRILAPTNCVLEVLSVKVGDVLSANREVATILLPQHLWVRVYVPEPWLGHIQLGEAVKVRVDSDPGKDFPGIVEQIAREAEFTPRNV